MCAGTGFSGLDKFYQEEGDTTAVPNTEGQTKHTLELWRVWRQWELVQHLSKPSDAPHWIWEELLGGDVRVTATWGCLSNT